jgi:hypothetical protein
VETHNVLSWVMTLRTNVSKVPAASVFRELYSCKVISVSEDHVAFTYRVFLSDWLRIFLNDIMPQSSEYSSLGAAISQKYTISVFMVL